MRTNMFQLVVNLASLASFNCKYITTRNNQYHCYDDTTEVITYIILKFKKIYDLSRVYAIQRHRLERAG